MAKSVYFKAKISNKREFKIIVKDSYKYMSIHGHLIPINMTDLKKIRDVINKLEDFEGDNSNKLLKQFKQLESEKGLYSKEDFQNRFNDLGQRSTKESLAEAIKEALITMPGGYSSRAFIRKLINFLLVKYGHKPHKTDYMPMKTRDLLKDLDINF